MKRYILMVLLFIATILTKAQTLSDEKLNKELADLTGVTVDEIKEFFKPNRQADFCYLDTIAVYPLEKEEAKKLRGSHSKLKIQNRDTLYFTSGIEGAISYNELILYKLKDKRSLKSATVVEKMDAGSGGFFFFFKNLEAGEYALVFETKKNIAYTFQIIGKALKPVVTLKEYKRLTTLHFEWLTNK